MHNVRENIKNIYIIMHTIMNIAIPIKVKHRIVLYVSVYSNSALNEEITNLAIELLTILGKAEAKIHAKNLTDVHFHELADWDSLMDVVASAVIINALANSSWSISKLPLGDGLVQTQHGLIPVPAPATAEILTGFEFFDDGVKGERITPTGAAILSLLRDKKFISFPTSR